MDVNKSVEIIIFFQVFLVVQCTYMHHASVPPHCSRNPEQESIFLPVNYKIIYKTLDKHENSMLGQQEIVFKKDKATLHVT